jgi:hypothetical protein
LSCRHLRAVPLCAALAACGHDWDELDPRLGAGAASASSAAQASGGATSSQGSGGAGGASSSAASTTTAASTTSATIGSGGASGLVDRGLLVRYYLDEADSGQAPTEALDAAPDPLPLPLTYTPGMSYASVDGHRGLSWNAIELSGRASAPTATNKLAGLDGLEAATIESVVELSAVSSFNSRISHIGTGSDSGIFTLSTGDPGILNFFWRPGTAQDPPILAETYPVAFPTRGRVVLHLVLDVAAADAASRARLFVDAAEVSPMATTPPQAGQSIVLAPSDYFVLGNREEGMRSFVGVLYYSAMYTTALTDLEVQNNAAVLAANDDTP